MKNLLHKILKSFKSDGKGFTLMDLAVSIAILGVLAGITTPIIGKFFPITNLSAANAELATIQTATNSYVADNPSLDSTAIAKLAIDDVAPYIRGGAGVIKGIYAVTSSGVVVPTGAGSWSDIDVSDGKFIKAP
jgi:type II secretory pathway pseudopilin PulG